MTNSIEGSRQVPRDWFRVAQPLFETGESPKRIRHKPLLELGGSTSWGLSSIYCVCDMRGAKMSRFPHLAQEPSSKTKRWFAGNHGNPLSQFSADSRHSREPAMLFSRTSREGPIEFAIYIISGSATLYVCPDFSPRRIRFANRSNVLY